MTILKFKLHKKKLPDSTLIATQMERDFKLNTRQFRHNHKYKMEIWVMYIALRMG